MTLSTPLPAGTLLVVLIVGFWVGLIVGWLAQQALDRVLRFVAVRATVAAMQPAGMVAGHLPDAAVVPELSTAKPNLAPWFVERPAPIHVRAQRVLPPAALAGPTTTPVAARPGMPYYRDPSGDGSR
jgi:hypothetical protein